MKMKQKLSLVIILTMLLSLTAPVGLPAYADTVSSSSTEHTFYINEGDITMTAGTGGHDGMIVVSHGAPSVTAHVYENDTLVITGTTTANRVLVDGVKAKIAIQNVNIQSSGAAFELKNNADGTLTLEGANILKSGALMAGLQVSSGNTVTINGTGSLNAQGGSQGAGIGGGDSGAGGDITIEGGDITATGGDMGAGIGGGYNGAGGDITIEGGTVTARGGSSGAGIGGGISGVGGTTTIEGGTVTATGEAGGAGIGGGAWQAGGSVTIEGGTVTATGGDMGAGIGGGYNGAGGSVTIEGGTVTATGGDMGAGIGGGDSGAGGDITIEGGTVTATSGGQGAGIGGGIGGAGGTITINAAATVKAASETVSNPAIHTLSDDIEAASTAAMFMANLSGQKPAGTPTHIHVKDVFNPMTSFSPTRAYQSIAVTVPADTSYQVKTDGHYQQHLTSPLTEPSTDFVIAGAGLAAFDDVENAANPPIVNDEQAPPTGLAGIAPTSTANNDGKITGTTTTMEYKLHASSTWLEVTGTEITGLSAGTYNVRYRAKVGFHASPSITITIPTYTAPSTGGGGSGSSSPRPPATPSASKDITIIVNNETQKSGTETRTEIDGRTEIKLVVDSQQMKNHLENAIKENNGTNEVIIPVTNTGDIIKVVLTGDILKKMEDHNVTLSVREEKIEYRIDSANFTIEKIAQTMGISLDSLQSIDVEISINKIPAAQAEALKEQATASGHEILFDPVQFEITARATSADGKVQEVKINQFSHFAERIMGIPEDIDPSKVATGIVFHADGSYSHVPTVVFEKDGKWYARISSLTNSIYTLIGNPITVAAVENHWSKVPVNDMAARLIISNPNTFEPDQPITRGEFAQYITKALGIYRTDEITTTKFTDVSKEDKLFNAITVATEYGLISGYPDRTFKPNDQITREEAMSMYARAMEIVGLKEADNKRIEKYKDKDQVADWAYEAVKKTVSIGVFSRKTGETINPKDTFTHAEAATAVRNLLVKAQLINP
ncbi:S-layer homology domain-containing protein [Anoxynatronum buryatiense]|uniref:S-layer homology domain-containing protein n=2 Tax=Anoxynatronum buryatiense TaxID=489973 RepID=A0AA45WZE2_9CLOT|nr:S-layer homology domain-containing protein [Anoxynatronum buryatiense]